MHHDIADELADYFRLELRPAEKPKGNRESMMKEPVPFDRLEKEIAVLNETFPRPNMPPIVLSNLAEVRSLAGHKSWPNADLPGVYLLLTEARGILYVGSALKSLRARLRDYFSASGEPKVKVRQWIREVEFVATIGIPSPNYFEALAVEEFLINRLDPPYNDKAPIRWQSFLSPTKSG